MMHNCILALLVLSVLSFAPGSVYGANASVVPEEQAPVAMPPPAGNPVSEPGTDTPPPIEKIREGVFRIGGITVHKIEGYVSAPGAVNMDEGIVEYLACGPAGKLHESILRIDVRPYNLQIALLLLGLKPGDAPLSSQGAPETPKGGPVEIWVTWKGTDGQEIRRRAEDLIYNKGKDKPMQQTHWIFTGSQIIDGKFMAEIEQSIAATYHDPFSILDHPLASGGDDTLYFVNSALVPPKGTPVTFLIKSLVPQQN